MRLGKSAIMITSMKDLQLSETGKAIVIVAHPDDETIWMGGAILRYPKLDWTILSICRASDEDRAPKFKKVCAFFGANPIITDLDDDDNLSLAEMVPLIEKIVIKASKGSRFDYLFTHGPNGEYGHRIHRGTHQAVGNLLSGNRLKTSRAFCFSYKRKSSRPNAGVSLKSGTEFSLSLTKNEFERKLGVMSGIYGFAPDGIDVSYCLRKEGFTILK